MYRNTLILAASLIVGLASLSANEVDLSTLFEERIKSVVSVEFFIQKEIDRESRETIGLVLDDNGLIILAEGTVPSWTPVSKFEDFTVYIPGKDHKGYDAEYLGQDYLTGWDYIRVEEAALEEVMAIQNFEVAEPRLGESIWGIALLPKDYDFAPGLLKAYLGLTRDMPHRMHFTDQDIASPGAPIFNMHGDFIGWGNQGVPEDKIMYMGRESYSVGLVSPRGTRVFHDAADFLERAFRVPAMVTGSPRPWIGIAGMQPVDQDAAEFLGLENQGAVMISNVIEGGPAAAAGLLGRDIVTGVDGEPLPKFRPDSIVLREFEERLRKKSPGDTVTLAVVRGDGGAREELSFEVGQAPTHLRDAPREYFSDLGFSVRAFTLFDAIGRRVLSLDYTGVITQFVRPNSSTASAGLLPGDWIQEIDGIPVNTYDDAIHLITTITEDPSREEFVLLISRNNETQVLRVKIG